MYYCCISLSLYLSIYLSLSIYIYIHLSLSIYLSLSLSIYIYISIHTYTCTILKRLLYAGLRPSLLPLHLAPALCPITIIIIVIIILLLLLLLLILMIIITPTRTLPMHSAPRTLHLWPIFKLRIYHFGV